MNRVAPFLIINYDIVSRLPERLLTELVRVLSEKRRLSWRARILCSSILQEYGPLEQHVRIDSLNPPQDLQQIPHVLPLILNQVCDSVVGKCLLNTNLFIIPPPFLLLKIPG